MRLNLKSSLVVLAAAGALAVPAAPAFAQAAFSGFVNATTGAVSGSAGFTGTITATGSYTVTAPQSMFPSGFPVMTVTPFGINGAYTTGILTSAICGSGTCTFTVDIVAVKGAKLRDNAWAFTVIQD